MSKFIVKFKGVYLVKAPYWDGGTWTCNKAEAHKYSEESLEFFKTNYPQYECESYRDDVSKGIMLARKVVCFGILGMGAYSFIVVGIPIIGMFFVGTSVYLWSTYVY